MGPHLKANLEVLFTRTKYTYVVNYLTGHTPKTFSALIHQLTKDQVSHSLPF